MAEIKISDLSIGDWVMFTPDKNIYVAKPRFTSAPAKITGTYCGGEVILEIECHREFMAIPLSCIEPIPLTPEILEKNGLCVVEEDADFSEYELFGSENFSIFHTKGTFHYRLETPQASVGCWNVHQLQHALRLAGVEKEIEV